MWSEPLHADDSSMLSALLDKLMPDRNFERQQETLRLGLVRLQKPLPSDSDPINRTGIRTGPGPGVGRC